MYSKEPFENRKQESSDELSDIESCRVIFPAACGVSTENKLDQIPRCLRRGGLFCQLFASLFLSPAIIAHIK
jgi:hypothetical protein